MSDTFTISHKYVGGGIISLEESTILLVEEKRWGGKFKISLCKDYQTRKMVELNFASC